jgi:transcriptional regulator with XRE-family HTH domain
MIHLRKQIGWNQEVLANHLGKGSRTVWNWEKGTTEPSATELLALSELFSVSIDALITSDLEVSFDAEVGKQTEELMARVKAAKTKPLTLADAEEYFARMEKHMELIQTSMLTLAERLLALEPYVHGKGLETNKPTGYDVIEGLKKIKDQSNMDFPKSPVAKKISKKSSTV